MTVDLEKEAYKYFRNKDFGNAYRCYLKHLNETDENDPKRYINVNTIMASIYNLLIKDNKDELLDKYERYLNEYTKIAKSSNTTEWANNIIEDILSYSLEVCLLRNSLNNKTYEQQRKGIELWINSYIIPFINALFIEGKRDKKLFYDVIIEKIFKERTNFERQGNMYQNTLNTIILSEFYLTLTEDNVDFKRSRSNIYYLLSELVFNNPENQKKYHQKNDDSLEYLNLSLKEWESNRFAKERRQQTLNVISVQNRLKSMNHDLSNKVASIESMIKTLKDKKDDDDFIKNLQNKVLEFMEIVKSTGDNIPKAENVDLLELLNEIKESEKIYENISVVSEGINEEWISNRAILKVIFENLIKNSFEAYERNNISLPAQPVEIRISHQNGTIEIQDWAGGVPERFQINNLLFDRYVTEKGVYENAGIGLTGVKEKCEKIGLEIDYMVENNSTTFTIKKGA
ncbi:MAG: ATP-binding protein [Candidatus Cloacimonadales bacterium]|nr:ATP-binding protein [Candidatus Cloacimonadales bacterium]